MAVCGGHGPRIGVGDAVIFDAAEASMFRRRPKHRRSCDTADLPRTPVV